MEVILILCLSTKKHTYILHVPFLQYTEILSLSFFRDTLYMVYISRVNKWNKNTVTIFVFIFSKTTTASVSSADDN